MLTPVVGVVRDYNFATPLEVTGVVERLFEAVFMIGEDHMAVRCSTRTQSSASHSRLPDCLVTAGYGV